MIKMPSFSRRKTYSLHNDKNTGEAAGGSAVVTPPVSATTAVRTNKTAKAINRFKQQNIRKSGRFKKTRFKAPNTKRDHEEPSLIASDNMVLHDMAPSTPMPSESELNMLFAQMVDELGLNKEIMWRLTPEKKWQLYLSKNMENKANMDNNHVIQPQFYIEETIHLLDLIQNMSLVEADIQNNLKIANDLKTALRSQPLSFVLQFIHLNGLEYLLDFLRSMNNEVRQSQLHYIIIGCIKALMNNADGRAHVLAHPTGITIIAQSLKSNNDKTKILTLEILGALCLVPGGHKKVLNAMGHFQQFACERTRFQTVVNDLARTLDDEGDTAALQVAILSFLNALINYKAGEESLEFRLHLRYEFLMLGIQPLITRLRFLGISQLNKHIEIFEYVRVEDEKEFAGRLNIMERVDYTNVMNMTGLLQKKTAYTPAYVHLVSLLYHCLLLPVGDPNYEKYWRLMDRIIQQIVIQQDHGVDPDVSPLSVNVQKLVFNLLQEDEQRTLIKHVEDMKKAQEHMIIRLKKMEWECERTLMEKDAHKMSAEKMRQQLEAKVHEGMTLKDKQLELEGQIAKMTRQNDELKAHCDNLQDRLKEKNVDISDLPKYTPPPPAPPPPAPPPPLPSYIAPPPPPPPLPGGNSDANVIQSGLVTIRRRPKKSIPKLTNPLKSLNWEKMNDMQIGENTIWAGIDETPIYKEINLDDFQKTFTQRPMSSDYGTLSKTSRNKRTSREKLFIDSKRAQNCSILLTRLKLSNEQIRQAVMTMDPSDTLDKDMVEQLLKFIPSKEEYELLKANLSEMDNFSRADRFMLEMSHVPRYEKRLNALYFTKNFHERISEIHPNIESVTASCHELMMSEKLRKLLEIILAFGNIMNRGNRGNAFGFKLSSLNKITDTKSSTDNEMTLLHYLIQMLEAKFPEVVTLEVDLPHISEASKVDIGELEKEFKAIRKELKLLKEELDFHRLNPSGEESDRFVSAVEDFAFRADIDVKETEHFMKDMKEQFHKALRYFGEDPKAKDQTAFKFFGVFTKFLHSLSEAHVQLITIRKKKEEEEKRKKDEEQRKMDTLMRRKAREKTKSLIHDGDKESDLEGNLDELIARLYEGEPWNESVGKKRNRRMSSAITLKAWRTVSRDRLNASDDTHDHFET